MVAATTDYVAGKPVHTRIAEGEVLDGVTTSASIQLHFDRFLLPHKVTRQSVCLRADTTAVASASDCGDPAQAFTEPSYDPVLRQVTYRLPAGQRLSPDTTYRLTVFQELNDKQAGMFAFDGAPLARTYTFSFKTQGASGVEQDEPLPGPESYCAQVAAGSACVGDCRTLESLCTEPCPMDPDEDACRAACDAQFSQCVQPCFPLCFEPRCGNDGVPHNIPESFLFFTCGFSNCHSSAAPGTTSGTANGLNLKTIEGLRATAIDKVAHQTQQGQQSVNGDKSPLRFGRAMPNIDPGHPGNSYVLYKALIHPKNHYKADEVTLEPQLAAAIQRLRESVVVGLPMPAETGDGDWKAFVPLRDEGDPRSDSLRAQEHLEMVSRWIAHGAVTSCE